MQLCHDSIKRCLLFGSPSLSLDFKLMCKVYHVKDRVVVLWVRVQGLDWSEIVGVGLTPSLYSGSLIRRMSGGQRASRSNPPGLFGSMPLTGINGYWRWICWWWIRKCFERQTPMPAHPLTAGTDGEIMSGGV